MVLGPTQRDWLEANAHHWTIAHLGVAVEGLAPNLTQGLAAKVGDAASSTKKVMSLVSELDIARELTDGGWAVTLLSDTDSRFAKGPSPDLEISRDGYRAFVEVARIEDSHEYDQVLKPSTRSSTGLRRPCASMWISGLSCRPRCLVDVTPRGRRLNA